MGQGQSTPDFPTLEPLHEPLVLVSDRYVVGEQTTLVAPEPISVVGSYSIKSSDGKIFFKVQQPGQDGSLRRILYDVDGQGVASTNMISDETATPKYVVCLGPKLSEDVILGVRKEANEESLRWNAVLTSPGSTEKTFIHALAPFGSRQGELWLVNQAGEKQRQIGAFGIAHSVPTRCLVTGAAGIDASLLAVLCLAIQAEFSRNLFSKTDKKSKINWTEYLARQITIG
ncbi:hypothetical protein HK105_201118 [Polyrhizophydium stewartii]|uniref:Uncharacterized protein n=1 Tax=Polyrhizophydium stewartii TaxID=2732419 RepID=A0ABR4NIX1_9FUNG|nr:hypothetical protein HK105_002831 [Polyrhizophydium stewartii]